MTVPPTARLRTERSFSSSSRTQARRGAARSSWWRVRLAVGETVLLLHSPSPSLLKHPLEGERGAGAVVREDKGEVWTYYNALRGVRQHHHVHGGPRRGEWHSMAGPAHIC